MSDTAQATTIFDVNRALAVTENRIVSAVVLAEMDGPNWGETAGDALGLDLPEDDEEAFDALLDLAFEVTDNDDEADAFAAYHLATGGAHFGDIAVSGIAAVDTDAVQEMCATDECDLDYDAAVDAIVNLTKEAHDLLAADEGMYSEPDEA